ncbi:cysteine hydrolase family protein [Haloglycomyces albus]|uniref:cysteine hydrolase family protein n=1 Tax=Haloglycomyces albus TaxID=526067 RepID=UPI00046CE7F0|nr:isochorismatase family cysteine hydrolase [Haloglycomyces albus]
MESPLRNALIVVDMQNAFINPTAGLAVEGADEVVEAVNRFVTATRDRDDPVYYTRDIEPTALPPGDPNGDTEIHPDVRFDGVEVPKGPGRHGGFSGFVLSPASNDTTAVPGTGGLGPLAAHLRGDSVTAVTVVGFAADVCVSATARDARRLGYDVTVPLEASAFVHAHPKGDREAVNEMRAEGITVTP